PALPAPSLPAALPIYSLYRYVREFFHWPGLRPNSPVDCIFQQERKNMRVARRIDARRRRRHTPNPGRHWNDENDAWDDCYRTVRLQPDKSGDNCPCRPRRTGLPALRATKLAYIHGSRQTFRSEERRVGKEWRSRWAPDT